MASIDDVIAITPTLKTSTLLRGGLGVHRASGERASFDVAAAIETSLEVETLRAGGMLPMILHREMNAHKTDAGG